MPLNQNIFDYLRTIITRMVYKWRLEIERSESEKALAISNRQFVDYAAAFQMMGSFADIMDEEDIIKKIQDLCMMVFVPEKVCYYSLCRGQVLKTFFSYDDPDSDKTILNIDFDGDYLYTESHKGFYLKIDHQNEVLGILMIDEVKFPEYIGSYLNFSLTVSKICGLSISNARKYQEIKQSEETARERELLLRQITDNMMDVIGQVSTMGIIEYISPSCRNVLGCEVKDMIGKLVFDFLLPNEIYKAEELFQKAINSQIISKFQYKYKHPDGHYIWLEAVAKPLLDDNEGIKGIIFSIRNINGRKMLEENLRVSEERYRQLIDVLPDAVFIHYEEVIIFCNKAAANLVGAKNPFELYGKSLLDFIQDDYIQMTVERSRMVMKEKTNAPLIESKIICKTGKVLNVDIVSTYFLYKGKPMVLDVIRDISERKQIEELRKNIEERNRLLTEAQEYDKLKNEFFANISHEFRTPLNVLLGAIQLLNFYQEYDLLESNKGEIAEYIRSMRQNCYRLLRMVNNLIDITKMDSGFYQIHLSNENIVSIVEDITLSVAKYIEDKGRTLTFDTDIEEKIIACDPDKIERIILNLLANAVKFTKPGDSIMINIYDREDSIIISAKDNGVGIPRDKKNTMFQKFKQVDRSLTREHEGSGIGLSIVKSLVELHGGSISVESEYGKGSEFIIELPAKTIMEVECTKNKTGYVIEQSSVERVDIEFSDIYS